MSFIRASQPKLERKKKHTGMKIKDKMVKIHTMFHNH